MIYAEGEDRTLMRLPPQVFETCASASSATSAIPEYGGAEGDRTPDLLHAMQALSQLSYSPRSRSVY